VSPFLKIEAIEERLEPLAGSGREHLRDLIRTGQLFPSVAKQPRNIWRRHWGWLRTRHDFTSPPPPVSMTVRH
jgi:hypothetical protein